MKKKDMEMLEELDSLIENNYESIFEKISKTVSKDRDIIILKKIIEKQQKEIEYLKSKVKSRDKQIQDKIDEYTNLLMSCNRFSDVDRIKAINERILVLKELLESEE